VSERADTIDPWWKRWFINPVLKQLTQGISAEKLAWTVAIGCALGIFPIMGTTSLVCFLAVTQDYWLAAWHGIVAWLLVALPLILLTRLIMLPLLRAAALRIERRREASA